MSICQLLRIYDFDILFHCQFVRYLKILLKNALF